MTGKEKFNQIIGRIEMLVSSSYEKKGQISGRICREFGYDPRSLNVIFQYVCGESLGQYISDRMMMHSYQYLIECGEEPDLDLATVLAGKETQSSFNRSFKRKFGMTPTEACRKRDRSLLEPPARDLPEDPSPGEIPGEEQASEEERALEETAVRWEAAARDLEALTAEHPLPFRLELLICRTSVNFPDVSMEEVFDFAIDLIDDLEMHSRCYGPLTKASADVRDSICEDLADFLWDDALMYLCLVCELKREDAYSVQRRMNCYGPEIMQYPPEYLGLFADLTHMNYERYRDAYLYYTESATSKYGNRNFIDYILDVYDGTGKEEAFGDLEPQYLNYTEEHRFWDELWAQEQIEAEDPEPIYSRMSVRKRVYLKWTAPEERPDLTDM